MHTAVAVLPLAHVVVKVARNAGLVALFIVAAMLGILSGVMFAYAGDLPQVSALDNYSPSTITRIYASDGQVIGEFATQRRVVVGYDDINPLLRQAIIATEDAEFDRHFGVNIWRIFVAAVTDVIERRRAQGASTLTQQLARNLKEQFGLTNEKSFERKIREAILAIQIEKRYTKKEIFTIYCNQMYLGHGAYGVEAASRLYFQKSNKQLYARGSGADRRHLPDARAPEPVRRHEARDQPPQRRAAAHGRRALHHAGRRPTPPRRRPIVTRGQPNQPPGIAPFFVEEVRKHLEKQYGAKVLYENGLTVRTTLDAGLQELANKALEHGLRAYDKRHGWRKPTRNVVDEKHTIDGFKTDRWTRADRARRRRAGGGGDRAEERAGAAAHRRAPRGSREGRLRVDAAHLGGRSLQARRSRRRGDHQARRGDRDRDRDARAVAARRRRAARDRQPHRADQGDGRRLELRPQQVQPRGPGLPPARIDVQADRLHRGDRSRLHAVLDHRRRAGQLHRRRRPAVYSPHNYDHKFLGPITLRYALEESRNIPAIKVMDTLGPKNVLEYAKRFGFEEDFPPYLPIALGAGDATLLDITSAYTTFPNQGVRMKPYSVLNVKDRDGNLLEENRAEPTDVIRADTAFVMTNLLRGVLSLRGTGAKATAMAAAWPLAGKTGTVDDNTDAWFVGFDPDITVGVWLGFDDKRKSLGSAEQGAFAALPIWMEFMKAYIDGRPDKDDPPEFAAPGNIVFLAVDQGNGSALPAETPGSIREAFISGTQPGANTFNRQP